MDVILPVIVVTEIFLSILQCFSIHSIPVVQKGPVYREPERQTVVFPVITGLVPMAPVTGTNM